MVFFIIEYFSFILEGRREILLLLQIGTLDIDVDVEAEVFWRSG